MDEPNFDWAAEVDYANSAIVRSGGRRKMVWGAGLFGAWVLFLVILGLLYIRDEHGFERWVSPLADGVYGKIGRAILIVGVLAIALPPFFSAGMLLIGYFELLTGRSFEQLEAWFLKLSWPRKWLVTPILAAPLVIVSYGLIYLGAFLVRKYLR